MEAILFITVAFALGFIFLKFGLPPLLGYLAGGFLLSAFSYSSSPVLDQLAHTGVILLLFTLGLKIRLKNFLQPEVAVSGLLQIGISAFVLSGLFFVIGISAGFSISQTALLAILLGVASTVVAAKGLEDKGELDAYHGRLAIGILVMEDIILIGILAFTGLKAPSPWALALLLLPLLKPAAVWLLRSIKDAELLMLYGIFMALAGSFLFEWLHLGAELGAFCFGVLHAGEEKSDEMTEKLWGLREAFLIGFFLKIGLTGTPVWRDLAYASALVLFLPLRVGIFFSILTGFRLRARTAFLTATSLASFSEFALITGAVAISAGLLPESLLLTLATTVALSFLVGAPMNKKATVIYNRLQYFLERFERKKARSDAEPNSIGIANFIVVGMGRMGTAAYDYLYKSGKKVVGFDTDPGVLEKHRAGKRRILYGDASSKTLWENLDIDELQGVVVAIREEAAKLNVIETLRKRGFIGAVSAVTESEAQAVILKAAGVNTLFNPLVQTGTELAERVVMSRLPVNQE
ncbi:cation:proton antiporter family protein [Agriterribacter sp.]|uniref:cation:proton antiporter family protein n=1 Tax=Agriterribacter sp. TaxID=2821509 RepID=UPI002D00A30A|nr:cation:proton antiporter family protein [Agriterribacter sp.]HTN09157.1 cation:proton antiporter family protein [Agriterribacter sp.]